MKSLLHLLRYAALAACALLFSVPMGRASTTDTLYMQNFSSHSFPPWGWVDHSRNHRGHSAWLRASDGYNGHNGSALCDISDGSNGFLLTPNIDPTQWHGGDTLYLDFDFFWEFNYKNWGDFDPSDNFQVFFAQGETLDTALNLYTGHDYTYFNHSWSPMMDPPTSRSAWRHYHIAVPPELYSETFQVAYQGISLCGLSNAAIDNVMISGTHFDTITIQPQDLVFLNVEVGSTDTQRVLITNPNSDAISLSEIEAEGNGFFVISAPSVIPGGSVEEPTVDSILVGYSPFVSDEGQGTLTFRTSADYPSSVSIGLSICIPQLSVDPTQLFGHTRCSEGTTISSRVLVTNSGSGLLRLLPVTYIGGTDPTAYSISYFPEGGIPAGETDSLVVAFRPNWEGINDATLSVISNGGSVDVSLQGIGIVPHIQVTPNPVIFDPQPVGMETCQPVTIANYGSDVLRISGNFFASADADFTLNPLTGSQTTILPGDSQTLSICFDPARNGTRIASLEIRTNIPTGTMLPSQDSIVYVPITGWGISVGVLAMSTTPDTAFLGTTNCITEVLKNSGDAPVTVTSASFPPGSAFEIAPAQFPMTIPARGSLQVPVCFTPVTEGLQHALVVLHGTSNAIPMLDTTFAYGMGVAACATPSMASMFDGDLVLVGTSDTETVGIVNCTSIPIAFTTILSGNASAYRILTPMPTERILPDASVPITVVFTPGARVTYAAHLSIQATEGPALADISLGGVGAGVTATAAGAAGNQPVGISKSFPVTIYNSGNLAWIPGLANISGLDAADFTVASQITPLKIPAGGYGTIQIQFRPSSVGSRTALLTFPNSVPAPSPAFSYQLTGAGVSSAVMGSSSAPGLAIESVYPNPAQGELTVAYTLPEEGTFRITLTNATGGLVRTLASGMTGAGRHVQTLDLNGLASGSYFCELSNGTARAICPITVEK